LPGRAAHETLWAQGDPTRKLDEFDDDLRPAAVLLALYSHSHSHSDSHSPGSAAERDSFRIPLIERPASMPHHAGQVGLPGGAVKSGETPEATALREASEEIGLEPARVEILGRLSPIPVQVSRFRIDVFVGWIDGTPQLVPDPHEVAALVLADPDDLTERGATRVVRRERLGLVLDVPAYEIAGLEVWGATGFILAEFCWVWRGLA